MKSTLLRRPARPRPLVRGVTMIDVPDEHACGLPPGERLCVATACGAALTPQLGRMGHRTGCALDEGGLVADDRAGSTIERRRADCSRLWACEEQWVLATAGHNVPAQARCPAGCLGFVAVGSVVPVSALTRAKGARP